MDLSSITISIEGVVDSGLGFFEFEKELDKKGDIFSSER